jgi:hypothetical protein
LKIKEKNPMKWKVVLFAVALFLSLSAGADTYVKIERHTDGYYRGGTMNPAVDETQELWIGPTKIAFIADSQKMLLDAEKKTLVFINTRDNSYAETPLPLDMSKLFSEPDFQRLQMFQRTGEIKALEAKKKIGERACSGYEMSDWIPYQGGKVNEREVKRWVTTDVPFDLAKFNKLAANLLKLNNLADDYFENMRKIEGFPLAAEETTYAEGMAITTVSKVVEMADKEVPAEIFSIPEGCTKKETLSLQDM